MLLRRLISAFSAMLVASAATAEGAVTFTQAERAAILAHGPWEDVNAPDPSNRVSGNAQAMAFGQRLFFDKRLSRNQKHSCASCHDPNSAFTDGLPQAVALKRGDRNTPALFNMRRKRWFGWDGGSDSIWAQSMRAITNPREFASTPEIIARRMSAETDLRAAYVRVFNRSPDDDTAEAVLVNVAKALAAFQETLVTGETPFDRFRASLVAGRDNPFEDFSASARRGLKIFVGKGKCSLCHSGPNFSNGEFHDIGLPHFAEPGRVDPGRHGGIPAARKSRFNLLGPYNDDPSRSTALGTRHVRQDHRNWGAFAVPSLREVARTAPYMHDGSFESLRAVIRHYSELDEERLHADGERLLKPLRLKLSEIEDLENFLRSLSQTSAER